MYLWWSILNHEIIVRGQAYIYMTRVQKSLKSTVNRLIKLYNIMNITEALYFKKISIALYHINTAVVMLYLPSAATANVVYYRYKKKLLTLKFLNVLNASAQKFLFLSLYTLVRVGFSNLIYLIFKTRDLEWNWNCYYYYCYLYTWCFCELPIRHSITI